MTTEAGLLAAVFAEPHDDAPRLVYADWLDEHGDEHDRARAEFIRLQCEIARLDEDDPGYAELARRQSRLWNRNARRWRAGLSRSLRESPFVRGFLYPKEHRSYSPANFLRHAEAALADAPSWPIDLRTGKPAEVERLLASPLLTRIDSLRLADADESTAAVLAAPGLRRLRALEVWPNLTEATASAFIRNAGQGGLRELRLWHGEDGHGQLLLLGGAWSGLRKLELYNNRGMSREALRDAVDASGFPALRSLSYTQHDQERGVALSPMLGPLGGRLHRLEVWWDRVKPADLPALLGQARPRVLRHLWLMGASLGDAGARWLAAADNLAGLESLNLYESGVGKRGALALLRSPVLAGLTMLNLNGNPAAEDPAIQAALAERFPEPR
jgi:uncharacterized protein (TIGR02996 family)